MRHKFIVYVVFFSVLFLVAFLGFRPEWYDHLIGDVQYYYTIAHYFYTNHQLSGYPGPLLYPPGANLFFLLLSLPFVISSTSEFYQLLLVEVNFLCLYILFKIFLGSGKTLSNWIYLLPLLMLVTGPIILFRFDLVVVLLTVLAIRSFQAESFPRAGFYLGLATVMKIFPVVFLPYFLLLLARQKRDRRSHLKFLLTFLTVVVFTLALYNVVTKENLVAILNGLNFNFSKSVHIESVWASILTLIARFQHPGQQAIEFSNGVFVLTPLYLLGHQRLFRYASVLIFLFLYSLTLFKHRLEKFFSLQAGITLILALIISSQVISPQYLIWPFFLIPMLPPQELSTRFWKINVLLVLIALAFTQYIYPLNYNLFIFIFYGDGRHAELFIISALRNLILVILALRLLLVPNTKKSDRNIIAND